MIIPKCCTTLEVKEKHLEKWEGLIRDQLVYGGKEKYKCSDSREVTDIITETCGMEWIIGTCIKYLLRYKNLQRSKDLLKVAAYMYIMWLQSGAHLRNDESDTWNDQKASIGFKPIADDSRD